MASIKYLNTCACSDEMNRITSNVYVRLSHEYGICFLKRELIPTLGSICLKTIIANISTLRNNEEIAAYINLFDIVTLGLVELNFDETEKATNILPDFRIGEKGCEIAGMSFDKYNSRQVPLSKYRGRVLNVQHLDVSSKTWRELLQTIVDTIYNVSGMTITDIRLISVFLELFLEEVFYELREHKGEKGYSYKLYDLLYFNTTNDPELWGTDVMPEYKLMVKNDAYQEDMITECIEKEEQEMENDQPGLYWNR